MRLSMVFPAAFALALGSCAYPPANIAVLVPGQCETDGRPAPGDLLFVTTRMPDCAKFPLIMTDLRASRMMFGAASPDGSGTIRFYHTTEWFAAFHARLGPGRAPLLFIHGYNVSNSDALRTALAIRTAVGSRREVVALTWPSYAAVRKYWWDETTADWTTDQAKLLLASLAQTGRPTTLVAHSMGNRIALEALLEMTKSERTASVDELVMASPDVDRAKTIREAPALGIPVTIYASTRDQALSASWRDHGLPRAGDLSTWFTGQKPDPGAIADTEGLVHVVDTSAVTTGIVHHADYIATHEGATDLCRVIRGDQDPAGRTYDPVMRRSLLRKDHHPDPNDPDPCVGSGLEAANGYK